ncbi:MAG TPA: transporter substrate-binding domain-containing protein, partial [Anaerovoracaceae bacterium]|nr:transporter substrate-binding domain-containing protein [Anaerovoracaceae bacterium]
MIKYFKKTTIILTVVILLCLFSMHSNILFSYGNENETIKVGFYKWDGFNNMDEEGNLSGYGYEYLEHLSRYNDWNYEFMGYDNTWQESMKMLKTRDIDILCSMIKTAEREKEFLLSEYPMGSKKYTLTTLRNNEDYYLGDIDELNGITVGVFKDNASNELFTTFAKENDLNYTMVEAEGSNENDWLIKNLKNGNIDAIFSSEYRITEDEKILTNTGSIEFFIATNKNNYELMGEINQSIKELNSNEPLLATELGKKYFAKSQLGAPNFTREEVDFINSNKDNVIYLRAYNTNKPFYWIEDDVVHGIYANIIEKINALTGLKIKLSTSNEDIDGFIGVPSNLYVGRTINLKVTDTILEYNYAEIYYDNSNFSRVGLLKGHEEQTDIIESKYKESTLYRFDNFAKCAYAIEHKNVDAIFVDELSAQVIINQIYSNSINIYSYGNLKREESIGINDGKPKELLTIINKCIDPWVINNVDENISEVLYEATDDYNTYDFWASYKQAISVFTIMLLFAFLVIRRIWISNKEKLEKKNEELKSANSAKSEFLGRMSHDMRTPMNAIIGMSEFGMEEINDNKAKEYFGNINHSSKYLLSLLNDVLDLQRIEQGAIELKKDWTDFDEDYQMIVNIIEQRIKEKELKVELDIDDKLKNLLIYTDSIRYRQIMLNL